MKALMNEESSRLVEEWECIPVRRVCSWEPQFLVYPGAYWAYLWGEESRAMTCCKEKGIRVLFAETR